MRHAKLLALGHALGRAIALKTHARGHELPEPVAGHTPQGNQQREGRGNQHHTGFELAREEDPQLDEAERVGAGVVAGAVARRVGILLKVVGDGEHAKRVTEGAGLCALTLRATMRAGVHELEGRSQ